MRQTNGCDIKINDKTRRANAFHEKLRKRGSSGLMKEAVVERHDRRSDSIGEKEKSGNLQQR